MKDFDAWGIIKKNKQENIARLFYKEREIWWMHFGLNIGDEEDGKGAEYVRPVLVIRKFNANVFWGCALSSKIKNNIFYVPISIKGKIRSVIVSQLRLYDSKRLDNKIGLICNEEFDKIKKVIKDIL
jgi:mRNA-degrading endonuclease toxin of MazEF toxin-antitoxin module